MSFTVTEKSANSTTTVLLHEPAIVVVPTIAPTSPSASRTAAKLVRLCNQATIAVFLIAIIIPLIGFFSLSAQPHKAEKRNLRPAPPLLLQRWALQVFPFMFEAYFDDRVGLRKEFITARQAIQLHALQDSPSPFVWLGDDNWLYVNPAPTHGDLPALNTVTPTQIEAWANTLKERQRKLQAMGVGYVVVIAREKSTIYPEHLPAKNRRHPLPDLVPTLREKLADAPVTVVDMLPVLERGKAESEEQLYYKTDSHWNDHGCFLGYERLGVELSRLLPGYRAKTIADFEITGLEPFEGDLALLIGRTGAGNTEQCRFLRDRDPATQDLPTDSVDALLANDPARLKYMPTKVSENLQRRGKAMLIHDSFGVGVRQMLASDFGRLVSVGSYGLPEDLIRKEKPDLVIQLFVERALRSPSE